MADAVGPVSGLTIDTPFVDADTRAFLARLARDAGGASAEPTLEQRRAGLTIAVEVYGPEPAVVGSITDQILAGPHGPLRLRVYQPVRRDCPRGQRPLMLHIHGGGWALGDPDGYAPVVSGLCAAGDCVVVDVDYHRAPEHRYPVALEDCRFALKWARSRARRLGADPARIVVVGDSAGGHLAAGVCQTSRVAVALQVLIYPVMSASQRAGYASRRDLGDGRYFLRESDILRAETEYFGPGDDRERSPASPVLASSRLLRRQPPTWVITAGLDPLRDEGEAYARALQAVGVSCDLTRIEGTVHGFMLFAGQIAAGREMIAEIGRRVRAVRPVRQGLWG